MRHHALCGLVGIVATMAGCASGSADAVDSAEGEQTAATCPKPATPSSLDDLKGLSSCQLKALFESDEAKAATSTPAALANGAYEGRALCRKDIIPASAEFPPEVRKIRGAEALVGLLRTSDTVSNGFAGQVWHGKEFTLATHATRGSVLNFIDFASPEGITTETNKRAEAEYFIDAKNQWMAIDYTNAFTGIDGLLEGVSVKLIQHVYDTARLVNPKEHLYLGMAYIVNTPGKYEPGTPNTVPSCYFAIQRKDKVSAPTVSPSPGFSDR